MSDNKDKSIEFTKYLLDNPDAFNFYQNLSRYSIIVIFIASIIVFIKNILNLKELNEEVKISPILQIILLGLFFIIIFLTIFTILQFIK
jgi:amino acid transporter